MKSLLDSAIDQVNGTPSAITYIDPNDANLNPNTKTESPRPATNVFANAAPVATAAPKPSIAPTWEGLSNLNGGSFKDLNASLDSAFGGPAAANQGQWAKLADGTIVGRNLVDLDALPDRGRQPTPVVGEGDGLAGWGGAQDDYYKTWADLDPSSRYQYQIFAPGDTTHGKMANLTWNPDGTINADYREHDETDKLFADKIFPGAVMAAISAGWGAALGGAAGFSGSGTAAGGDTLGSLGTTGAFDLGGLGGGVSGAGGLSPALLSAYGVGSGSAEAALGTTGAFDLGGLAGGVDGAGGLNPSLLSAYGVGSVPAGAVTFNPAQGGWLDANGAVVNSADVGATQLDKINVVQKATSPTFQSIFPGINTLAPLAYTPAFNQLVQDFNPPSADNSTWSLKDWQQYLRLATAVTSLVGAKGAGGSDSGSSNTTTGSAQVPTTTNLIDPKTGLPATTTQNGNPVPILTPTSTAGPSGVAAPVGATPGFTAGTPQATGVRGSVSDDATVSGQLTKLLAANSPLIDQARARATQLANSRGLQNSTLAAQAGEEAAISSALPIAQQDASTFATQGQTNQAADVTQRALNEQMRQSDNAANQQSLSLAESARQFNIGTAQKDAFAQLDASTKTYLANVEAQYKSLTQASASAATVFNEYQNNVSSILASTTMDAANKQKAIDIASTNLKSAMAIQSAVSGLNLNDILQFANV